MFSKIKSLFGKSPEEARKQKIIDSCGCICYCKECGEPLNDNSDCKMIDTDGLYEYTCSACETKVKFHFGIAPVPILMED